MMLPFPLATSAVAVGVFFFSPLSPLPPRALAGFGYSAPPLLLRPSLRSGSLSPLLLGSPFPAVSYRSDRKRFSRPEFSLFCLLSYFARPRPPFSHLLAICPIARWPLLGRGFVLRDRTASLRLASLLPCPSSRLAGRSNTARPRPLFSHLLAICLIARWLPLGWGSVLRDRTAPLRPAGPLPRPSGCPPLVGRSDTYLPTLYSGFVH
jgi:hypothetical protein